MVDRILAFLSGVQGYVAAFMIGALLAGGAAWKAQGWRLESNLASVQAKLSGEREKAVSDAYTVADKQCNILLEKKGDAQKSNMASSNRTDADIKLVYAKCGTLSKIPAEGRAEPNGNYTTSTHFCMAPEYLAELLFRGRKCEQTENTAISMGAIELQSP